MDAWLSIVIRQCILYSLPVIISLTTVSWLEARWSKVSLPHPFSPITSRLSWLPWLAAIALHRGIIIAPPRILNSGMRPALMRLASHAMLCVIGTALYAWTLNHPSPSGLPPLHHWWAKVLMFFNLCMMAMHLLPLPGMLVGEWVATRWLRFPTTVYTPSHGFLIMLVLLAASPVLDLTLGSGIVFPVYEQLSSLLMQQG